MKILGIDDNQGNLTALKAMLSDRFPEARLLTALSGLQCVELARAEDPYVILLDILMPGMDGYTVCRKIKSEERLRSIPVVFLTTVTSARESRLKALEAGAEGFLSKPFDDLELSVQIRTMAKIKAANRKRQLEKEELSALVTGHTRALEQEMALREQAQEVLMRTAQEWQTTIDATNDVIWLLDKEQQVVLSNKATERIFQRPADACIGRHCWEIVHGTKEPIPECPVRRSRQSLRRENTELQIGEGWFEVTCDPIVNAAGQYGGAVHIVSDITMRKQAEEALRTSERQHRFLIQHLHAGVVIHSPDTQIILANEQASRLLGLPVDQMMGKTAIDPAWRFVREDETVMPLEEYPVQRVLATRQPIRNSVAGVDRPATEDRVWVLVNAFPELDAHGQLRQVVVTFVDITERKLAEEKLRDSELFFHTIINSLKGHICVLDETGKIVLTNQAWDDFAIANSADPQCVSEGVNYLSVCDSVTGPDFESASSCSGGIRAVLNKDSPEFSMEYPCHSPTEKRWFLGKVSPLQRKDSRWVVINHENITDRKLAEEERNSLQARLSQAQKLESVGRLAGGIAHDFNNMLGVILGYGEILFDHLHPGDPLRDDVKEILEAGRRSADLTRQLLAFSRRQTLQPEVLNLNTVIRNTEKMLGRLIGEDIELELALSGEIDRVMADPGQIEQVIMNLSVNARDAMPRGGKLILETANAALDETFAKSHVSVQPGKYVMLAVTDTGCGMDKETLTKIFDPFFTTKEKGKGTGLGLATVYGIVKQSGGNIWVYSEPGHGTTFKIYLSQTLVEREPKTGAVEKETPKGGGEHILVVEDEDSLRKLTEKALSKMGYKVSVAANGGEALLLMEKKGLKPDLVITDVVMPYMSGKELVNRLQINQSDLKVLYMSGYTDDTIVQLGVLDDGVHFVQKPFLTQALAAKVREALGRV